MESIELLIVSYYNLGSYSSSVQNSRILYARFSYSNVILVILRWFFEVSHSHKKKKLDVSISIAFEDKILKFLSNIREIRTTIKLFLSSNSYITFTIKEKT